MYVTASIFYNKENWHELIFGVISPFIEKEEKNLIDWQIYLSSNRGEHITFVFETQENYMESLDRFSIRTTTFMSESPSAIKPVNYPLGGFFSDFSPNSLHVNLENPMVLVSGDAFTIKIHHVISDLMLNAFKSEEIDNELIYTFFIYLILGSIKALCPNLTEATSLASNLLDSTNEGNSFFSKSMVNLDGNVEILHLFAQNKLLFKEIIQDIFLENSSKDESNWITKLNNLCALLSVTLDSKTIFSSIINVAWEHAGLNGSNALNELTAQTLTLFQVLQ